MNKNDLISTREALERVLSLDIKDNDFSHMTEEDEMLMRENLMVNYQADNSYTHAQYLIETIDDELTEIADNE